MSRILKAASAASLVALVALLSFDAAATPEYDPERNFRLIDWCSANTTDTQMCSNAVGQISYAMASGADADCAIDILKAHVLDGSDHLRSEDFLARTALAEC